MENILQAGFARVDITPDFPVGLAGYEPEEKRPCQGIRDPIYLTCIAVTSGDDTILLFDADLCSVGDWGAEKICEVVSPATGIPAERIYCGATHTHSAPQFSIYNECQAPFYRLLLDAAVEAAREALADRTPAQLLCTAKNVKRMNFVRHYLMEDGSYWGSNFGSRATPHVNHAAESDPRLMLLRFAREGKKDIVLMNWQAHNDSVHFVGHNFLSSSYTGEVRKRFEAQTDTCFAFFQGASGNQNPSSWIEQENHHIEDHFAYGRKLADYAVEFMKELKPVNGTDIVTTRRVFDAKVDHSLDHMVKEAKEVHELYLEKGKKEANALGKTYGFVTCYQAQHILMRSQMGPTIPIVLNAFRIGDMAFITAGNELFSTIGLHVRLHGPFENTFIITGNKYYLPCMAAYEYGAYEAVTSRYVKGTAEAVADTFVEMLESIC